MIMENRKTFSLGRSAALLLLSVACNGAQAQSEADIERLFDWAESTYPTLFGSHQTSQTLAPWRFRYYPTQQNYVGVNPAGEVYVLGASFGGNLKRVGLFSDFAPLLDARVATYTVGGAGADYPTLPALFSARDLAPGDVVDVRGGNYEGGIIMPPDDGGAPGNPVILRGVGATRPHLRGGTNTIEFRLSHHVVMEHFEISGTESPVTSRCVFHHAHDIVLRDVYIHDCPRHGVLGADQDSGSLTIEYSEIANAGANGSYHAIYATTDQVAHPGAVFRLQYSYVHDSDYTNGSGTGGNLIKSRSERNEIYYNWLEGAFYHELELIGPDPDGVSSGWTENLAREDSDVVGNVIVHTSSFGSIMRFGGDATGQTNGRYRFVNNTLVRMGFEDTPNVFRLFDGIESLDAHNNVFWHQGGKGLRIIRDEDAAWVGGVARINGSNNWIDTGSTFVPASFAGTLTGSDPGFVNPAAFDFRLAAGSPLLGKANASPVAPAAFVITSPLFPPARHPPLRAAALPGAPLTRPVDGALDIGAFEAGN
jgi:hypothetical protein